MKSPFRVGQKVCVGNDKVVVHGVITQVIDIGDQSACFCVMMQDQDHLDLFVADLCEHRSEIDVMSDMFVYKGYSGSGERYPDGYEILVVGQ